MDIYGHVMATALRDAASGMGRALGGDLSSVAVKIAVQPSAGSESYSLFDSRMALDL